MTHPTATDLDRARADLVDAARAYEQAAKAHSAALRSGDEVPAITALKLAGDMLASAAYAAAGVIESAAETVRKLHKEHGHFADKSIDLDRKMDDIKDLLAQAIKAAE